MSKKTYEKLLTLFPNSPLSAVAPPETFPKGKIVNYTARLTAEDLDAIAFHCTGENPTEIKNTDDLKAWTHAIQYNSTGEKLYETYTKEDGSEGQRLFRRWEPTHFLHNRNLGAAHRKTLTSRFSRIGYKSALRKIVFAPNGQLLDGMHSLIALWFLLKDYSVPHVDVSIEINDHENPNELFRLFDQAQRRRTLRDALTTSSVIPNFEAELAGTLRFCTLLASGRGINQSRLSLDHIVNEKGKPLPLQPDDIAGMISEGEPFNYVMDFVPNLLDQTTKTEEGTTPTLLLPEVSGPGFPNPQYWIVAFLNCLFDPRNEISQKDLLTKFSEFLTEVSLGAESKVLAARKLSSYKPPKAVDWLAAIECCLDSFLKGSEPKRISKVPTYTGIQNHYSMWFDDNAEDYLESEVLEELEDSEEPEYEDA